MKHTMRRIFGILLLLVSLAVLGWGLWPSAIQSRQMPVASNEIQLPPPVIGRPTSAVSGTALPVEPLATQAEPGSSAIPEQRLLTIEWPATMRVGDAALITLALEMDDRGQIVPTVVVDGSQSQVERLEIPNLFETHNVIAEARLDMAGMEYRPEGEISEALLPGSPVKFVWSVRPFDVGAYRGTVWLHLRFIPKAGGEEMRNVLTAQIVNIEVLNFLGLKGPMARLLGGLGTVLGTLLGLDGVVEWFWKALRRSK